MNTKIFFADINVGAGYGFDRLGPRPEPRLSRTRNGVENPVIKDEKPVEAPFKGA